MSREGFTLIELLVVIAIIGILAAVIIVALREPRTKSQIAQVHANLAQIVRGAVLCVEGGTLQAPVINSVICVGGGVNVGNWPQLPTGWDYCRMDMIPNTPGCSMDWGNFSVAGSTFKFAAVSDSTVNKAVACNQTGCVVRDAAYVGGEG